MRSRATRASAFLVVHLDAVHHAPSIRFSSAHARCWERCDNRGAQAARLIQRDHRLPAAQTAWPAGSPDGSPCHGKARSLRCLLDQLDDRSVEPSASAFWQTSSGTPDAHHLHPGLAAHAVHVLRQKPLMHAAVSLPQDDLAARSRSGATPPLIWYGSHTTSRPAQSPWRTPYCAQVLVGQKQDLAARRKPTQTPHAHSTRYTPAARSPQNALISAAEFIYVSGRILGRWSLFPAVPATPAVLTWPISAMSAIEQPASGRAESPAARAAPGCPPSPP